VIAGKSGQSQLIKIILGEKKDIKSYDAHVLPAKDIATIKKWIDSGADWPAKPESKN